MVWLNSQWHDDISVNVIQHYVNIQKVGFVGFGFVDSYMHFYDVLLFPGKVRFFGEVRFYAEHRFPGESMDFPQRSKFPLRSDYS